MKITLALLAGLLLQPAWADLGQLRYLTEDYKPYNYVDPQGQPTGFAVEILKLVWKNTGTTSQPITIMPWARGYYLLSQEPNTVLFTTARTRVRDPLFKWACSIGEENIVLIGLKSRDLHIERLSDANPLTIGAVRADVGEQLLLNAGYDESHILPANRLSQALLMLSTGRVDLLATNQTPVAQLMQEAHQDPKLFKTYFLLNKESFCYAFNRQISDSVVQAFQVGLDKVLASPEYPKLKAKYFTPTAD